VPALRLSVINTTGAGDAFNAGLLWGLSRGGHWDECVRAAVTLAPEVVSRPAHDRYPSALQFHT
jgi:sugar/nucleoside kinase (ribokinase family)